MGPLLDKRPEELKLTFARIIGHTRSMRKFLVVSCYLLAQIIHGPH